MVYLRFLAEAFCLSRFRFLVFPHIDCISYEVRYKNFIHYIMKDFVCCGQTADKPVKHDRFIELFSNHLNPFLLETDLLFSKRTGLCFQCSFSNWQ